MIASLKSYWMERSRREQVLLGIMGALFALVILWLGIIRPVDSGLASARGRHAEALERNAQVRAKVEALRRLPRGTTLAVPLDQLVGQSAGEAGFTLERNQPQGPGRVDIAIASAKPTAFLAWIAALEAQGVTVETLTAQPAPTAGAISVQAVLQAGAR